jgi:drug/metabolite transporter (DMT)-like permease
MGYLLAFLSALLFGASAAFAKFASLHGVTPATLALASALAMLASAIPGLLRHGLPPRAALWPLALLAPIYAAFAWAYQTSLAEISAPLAMIILFTHPVLVVLYQGLAREEKLTRRQYAASALAFVGILVAASDAEINGTPRGILLAAFSSLACAATIVLSARAAKSGAGAAHAQAGLGLSIVFLMPLILSQGAIQAPQGIAAIAGVLAASFSIGLGLFFFLSAMARIGASRTALISNLEPAIGFAFAWWLANEALTPQLLTGSLVVVIALIDWGSLVHRRDQGRPSRATMQVPDGAKVDR